MLEGDINVQNLEVLGSTLRQKFREHFYQPKVLDTVSMPVEVVL